MVLDRTTLTRRAAENRQLFFAEQLETVRGGESWHTRSLISGAAPARGEAVTVPTSSASAVRAPGSHQQVLRMAALRAAASFLPALPHKVRECFPSPSPLLIPPLQPLGFSLG